MTTQSVDIPDIKLTPMLTQYMAVKKAHPDCLLFFRLGDFYELFFEDAQKASKALDITLTRRGKSGEDDIPMCGVPFHAADSYLAKLIRLGFKVAICEQMETPEEAKKNAKSTGGKPIVRRDVVRIITPGTLTEEALLDPHHHNYLAALVVEGDRAAFAWVDVSTGDFLLESLKVQDLSSSLARMNPSEILLKDDLLHRKEIEISLSPFQKNLTFLPPARFDEKNGERRLKEIFEVYTLAGFGSFSAEEFSAGGALLDYVLLTQKGKVPHLRRPQKIQVHHYLEIDAATRRTLELTQTQTGELTGSLFWALNRTVTPFGGRLLSLRLKSPLKDPIKIEERLEAVDFFVNHQKEREGVRNLLKSMPDLNRILGRLSLGRGGPRDVGALLMALEKVSGIKALLEGSFEKASSKILKTLFEDLSPLLDLQDHIQKALDFAQPLPTLAREGGFIAPEFHKELEAYRLLKTNGHSLILDLQKTYVEKTGIGNLKIKHNNILGYFIEITALNASKMDITFIHRQTLASVMRYTTGELSSLEDKMLEASVKILQIELDLYDDLVKDVLNHASQISQTGHALAALDVFSALAFVAIEGHFTRPSVDDSLVFDVEEGRHWGVELSLKKRGNNEFVANGCTSFGDQALWLLTGPNMAGKSTFLRQNALLVVLAQMGSFVPAKRMHLGVVDKLFSRVGASDDLARGQSTFMVEMVETAAILNQATKRSFVILDEIGRGTSTYDGLSIAWSCLEYLHTVIGCRALFATHYHELTDLKETLSHLFIVHMAIQEWEGNVVFLYRIQPGKALKSYGLHVARLAGLPPVVLERAEEVLKTLESHSEKSEKGPKTKEVPLPLFEHKKESIFEKVLEEIQPDLLSPREALEKIYALKVLFEKER
ncbi:MAG: DNA mismatch repair protein MutS [Alphaproteobacteria bacterium 16-39-46]|nr:MAG: DNA mismatch repair protein MutS [Alphaproteobacteria bacterium 16-39-46]OZA42322.1 MAG: DNA mismatch repair protein MutS [Alphaproteobacteria bacterium 17-39-52]HQS84526.1 DNA mismatch repair protein MutS [Alphaproteobacteria bacterium]HQS94319.1 DNA mismatch repair protein MutS [Alphaproteobacteria bacterium]